MLCVIAKLDDASTEKLAAIRNAAFPDGETLRPLHGHITLAAYIGADEDAFLRSCRELLAGTRAFAVAYTDIEVLEETSILVAVPERSGPLERLHRQIAERYPDALDPWTEGDRWYPHTTLYYGPGTDLPSLCRKMKDAFCPFTAAVSRIEFSRVLEDGYRILDSVNLPMDGPTKTGSSGEDGSNVPEELKIEFIPAKASEAADVGALRQRIWETTYRGIYPDAVIEDFDYNRHRERDLKKLADPSFTVCLIRNGEEKIGYLIIQEADSGLVLQSLYVLREYQHRGIGKKAFALLRDRCREKGLRGLSCQCNPHNENAMEFYRRMGGTVTKTDIGHENRQEDTVVFRFDLPADDRKGSDTGGGSITSGGGGLRAAVFP